MDQFEDKCGDLIDQESWDQLEIAAVDQLDETSGKCHRGYFYLGIAMYKMEFYDQAIIAFMKSSEIKADDAQLQYNLGLSYFKEE